MGRSNAEIRNAELLLTLDYLLHYTDEDHPATHIDICEHARNYGLKFDKNKIKGNDVKRQRIGECLKFLKHITEEYTDSVPFVLERTDSGKYYIEQRNGLNETQVAKILAAIKNDKYTKSGDTELLIERVLSAFSTSEDNKRIINNEYKALIRGGQKLDKAAIRKINIIEKAYRENKLVKIESTIYKENKESEKRYFWYKVYLIKEYKNKLHAFMLFVAEIGVTKKSEKLLFSNNYIFDPIEKISIAEESLSDVLCEDPDPNRDFERLFRTRCEGLAKKYGTIDNFIAKSLLPTGGKISVVSFYFNLNLKDILKRSFENFFSEEFRYQETNMINGIEKEVKDFASDMDNWVVVTEEPKKNEKPMHGLVNISVDSYAFKSWLLSDPHGEGRVCIADMVTIIKPSSINKDLVNYFSEKLLKRVDYLTYGSTHSLMTAIKQAETRLEHDADAVKAKLEEAYAQKQNLHLIGPTYETGRIVRRWLEENKDKVNGYYINGPLLKTFFDETLTVNGHIVKGQIFASNEIDNIASYPNRVIVINDYQLMDENVKEHILLLEEGYVVDSREENGFKKLDNLEFVCVIKTTNV